MSSDLWSTPSPEALALVRSALCSQAPSSASGTRPPEEAPPEEAPVLVGPLTAFRTRVQPAVLREVLTGGPPEVSPQLWAWSLVLRSL